MKRIITVLFAALFCLCAQTYAQNRADELMKQAQESLAKKRIYQGSLPVPTSL